MNGVLITYGDVTKGAKESFSYLCNDSHFGEDYKELLKKSGSFSSNYACPCELYQTFLDGSQEEYDEEKKPSGLWSESLSGSDGTFENPPVLIMENSVNVASSGFTFTFDTVGGIYPKKISIKWEIVTENGVVTADECDFFPDSPFYFCNNYVESFNRAVVTFHSMVLPYNRLKLFGVDFGFGTSFYGDELRDVSVSQSLDVLSSEIEINTLSFTLDSKTDREYSFQAGQELNVFFDDRFITKAFVSSSVRTGERTWEVEAEDCIGLCEDSTFCGGIYKNKCAGELFEEILDSVGISYEIGEEFYNVFLSGHIPYGTAREALMQTAFASCATVDTSGVEGVKIFSLPETVSQTIPLDRILEGQSFNEETPITTFMLDYHEYIEIESGTAENEVILYSESESGTGKEILVKFDEPYHDLIIVKGEILSSSANHALINAEKGCVLIGFGYEHRVRTKFIDNETLVSSSGENVCSVENATLVAKDNCQKILSRCYEYLTRKKGVSLSIIEGRHVKYGEYSKYGVGKKYGTGQVYGKKEDVITYDAPTNVGDRITAQTEYLGEVTGTIISQTFNLNGYSVVKESELK